MERKLGEVLSHTDLKGHTVLKAELNDVKEQWRSFLNQCKGAHDSINEAVQDRGTCEGDLSNLEEWVAMKEHVLREQALRSTLEAKQAQLQNVKVSNNIY